MGDFFTDLNKHDQVQLPRYIAALENVRHVPDEYVLLGILKNLWKKIREGPHKELGGQTRKGLAPKHLCQ